MVRVIFDENFIFLDFIIKELTKNLKDIEFNEKNIEKNLNLTKGACLTEKVMVELVDKGIGRQEGHEMLRQAAKEYPEALCYDFMGTTDTYKNYEQQVISFANFLIQNGNFVIIIVVVDIIFTGVRWYIF